MEESSPLSALAHIVSLEKEQPNDDFQLSNSNDHKAKRERASWEQRIILEKLFQTNQYPDLPLRTKLSEQLGMTPRKIQIWFQNRRTKAKNTHLKTTQDLVGMIENGADINLQNKNGNTLLLIASASGHQSVKSLLAKGAKCNIANNKGQTPLYMAVKGGHETIVEMLLQPEYKCSVNSRELEHGESPLHIAALRGFETICLMLLLNKGEPINVNIRDYDNFTPLHHACIYGHTGIVRQLLDSNADVNVTSTLSYTPLHCASLGGHTDIVTMLLERNANVNAIDSMGYSALSYAIRECRETTVELLLSKKASLIYRTEEGFTPLHIACCRINLNILKLLVEKGAADVHCLTNKGLSCVHIAAMTGNLPIIQYILEKGVDPKKKDKEGKMAVDYARIYNNIHAVDYITSRTN